jgi:hypothetical protein
LASGYRWILRYCKKGSAMRISLLTLVLALAAAAAGAQPDPVIGNWRGSLKSASGTESPIVLTIAKNGDRYYGSTNGLSEGADVALQKIQVTGSSVSFEASADSPLGVVALSANLTAEANRLNGDGTVSVGPQRLPVSFSLQRRARSDVVQHQVEQTADYFVGRWQFDYIGGEFPPLSIGNRKGAVAFARIGTSPFVAGTLRGDSFGSPFEYKLSVGVDAETDSVLLIEKREDGTEITSLGNWHSPLAVVFLTAPLQTNGRSYQLKRVFSILSETAFDVSEEYSVDGGPFRRLGTGHFTKQ